MTHRIFYLSFILLICACNSKSKSEKSEEQLGIIASTGDNFLSDYFLPSSTTGAIVTHEYYTLSYNENKEQAEWVAYALFPEQLRYSNFRRPYFIEDPEVSTGSANWKNYIRSGYDRGHLCPAGDRRFSLKAFNETFYTSNVTPQRNDFNAGIWNRLEQKVRYWAKKKQGIYVVTGGVLKGNLKTIGRESVAVPDYFYKILLDKEGKDYKVIAFLLPHQETSKPLYDFVVPIDQIEKLSGINFFPKLPDVIENKLEKEVNYKDWSF